MGPELQLLPKFGNNWLNFTRRTKKIVLFFVFDMVLAFFWFFKIPKFFCPTGKLGHENFLQPPNAPPARKFNYHF